jgi:hypothetical protein
MYPAHLVGDISSKDRVKMIAYFQPELNLDSAPLVGNRVFGDKQNGPPTW